MIDVVIRGLGHDMSLGHLPPVLPQVMENPLLVITVCFMPVCHLLDDWDISVGQCEATSRCHSENDIIIR